MREYNNYIERIPAGIRELQMENRIYLYGNGAYADKIMDILEKYSINIDAVVVSKEYYTGTAFRNNLVICYEEMLRQTDSLVVVAGFDISSSIMAILFYILKFVSWTIIKVF